MRFVAAFPCHPWSLCACRPAAGRCQASYGGWFWVGRDVLEVPPFRNRLTLPGLPALSRPNVGREQIAAIACPSRLCLFYGTPSIHTSLRRRSCFRWKAFILSVSDPVRPYVPAMYRSTGLNVSEQGSKFHMLLHK